MTPNPMALEAKALEAARLSLHGAVGVDALSVVIRAYLAALPPPAAGEVLEPVACEHCGGSGYITKWVSDVLAAGDVGYIRREHSDVRCSSCNGTGRASTPAARAAVLEPSARPLDEWSEEDGNVVWWCWRDGAWLGEPAYIGTPLDLGQTVEIELRSNQGEFVHEHQVGGWPGYHTHWTPHPSFPAALKEKT